MQDPNHIFVKSEIYFQKRHELSKVAEHLHHRMLISQGAKPQKAATNFHPHTNFFDHCATESLKIKIRNTLNTKMNCSGNTQHL